MKKLSCLGTALLLLPGIVFAQEPCRTRNTAEINQCAQQALERKDRELNTAYQALLKSLDPTDKADAIDYAGARRLLQQAQRAWIQFRDNDCKAKYMLNAGGTVRDIAALSCQIEHTEQRTKQLRDWLKA
ncbi:hypothetical protein H6CHR_02296 [Variovorax sp. PBL-H6]|uniref:lysozyme inhibitor LprI family protein n=1 Tax=Variovorax sp. PBL-H6 TaxID=434009 RepID=UPI001318BE97|nr:lysozyme inhibitor LprI family protein [Variovorax sp. PBL-H6]VTU24952.1 hypothetical protein H6CHR_02296 [Variovorax sp. PBL-H6]